MSGDMEREREREIGKERERECVQLEGREKFYINLLSFYGLSKHNTPTYQPAPGSLQANELNC